MKNLAINGAAPVAQAQEFQIPSWPPVNEETADSIRALYLSRQWSFNSASEQEFEQRYAEYHGAKYGIFMSNGTVTLECALLALGVGPGDEVIVPALTWIATAMAVHYVGAKVVFADIEKTTFALDPASLEERITPRTKAIIPVHLYGSMADLEKILAISKNRGIAVIEDCAHMQGGKWDHRGVGSWGDIGSFSFQQSKTLSCGEGGICLTNDVTLAERLYRAKHIGYSRYDVQGQAGTPPPAGLICHNYRGLAFCAKILTDQLKGLPEIIDNYNIFASDLKTRTADIEGLRLQQPGRLADPQGYYGLGMVFDSPRWNQFTRTKIAEALFAEGIRLSSTYGPVYKHLLFNMNAQDYRMDACPTTERISARTLILMHYAMMLPHNLELLDAALHKLSDNLNELEAL